MKNCDLSIIIPIYNGQEYIDRCLASVLNQRNSENYEIIAVNDGSTDETKKILDKFAQKNKNIRIINQSNAGVSVARNNGIRAAHGKYITFVDCDDMVGLDTHAFEQYFLSPNYRSQIGNMKISTVHKVPQELTTTHFNDEYFVNMLNAAYDTDADVVLGGKITINQDEIYMRRHIYDFDALYGTSPEDKDIILRQADVRENANFALYRRNMLYKHNLRFLPNMKLDEDMLFCMLAALYAHNVATVKNVTYFYNRHSDTLSNIPDFDDMMQKYKISNIQRFSVLLNEISQRPQYAKVFNYWMREYSKKGTKFSHESGEFPSKNCNQLCGELECTGCIFAEGMREKFQNNIAKYIGIISK